MDVPDRFDITVYLEILDRLEAAGIPTCVLHGWQESGKPASSDLDVAVRPENLADLSRVLADQEDIHCVQLLSHESTCHYFVLVRREGPAVRFLRLDVAADFRRDRRIFLTSDELFRDPGWQGSLRVCSAAVELPYLLVKKVLKTRLLPRQGQRLQYLLSGLGAEGEQIVKRLFGDGAGARVLSWIRGGKWRSFEDSLSSLRRSLLRRSLWLRPLQALRYLLEEIRRVALRLQHPTGLFVAVLGPDGAGKSAMIWRVRDAMGGAFRASELFHLRPGLLAYRGAGGDPSRPHEKPPYPFLLSLLKLAYLTLDYVLGYLLKIRPALVRSTLVLFDRYFDDLLVDSRRYRYAGPVWAIRAARRIIPKPDLILFLDVPEDQLLARKAELPTAEAVRQRAAYRRLAAALPNSVLLDGSLPETEVAQCAVEAILFWLRERYTANRRLWFRVDPRETLRMLSQAFTDASLLSATSRASRPPTRRFALLSLHDGRGFLIPLGRRRAAAGGLRLYSAQSRKARTARGLLEGLLRAGITPGFLPRVAPAESSGMNSLLDHLGELFGDKGTSFAVSLGTPGAHRKPVIQVLDPAGRALGFAKLGWNTETEDLLRNEARALESLRTAQSFRCPELLQAGTWGKLFLLVQSAAPRAARRAPRALTPPVVECLREMQAFRLKLQPLEDSFFWARLEQRVVAVTNPLYRGLLARGMQRLRERLRGRQLPFHLSHGDFAPWNMFSVDQSIYLFDWEYSDSEVSAGYDLFHFLVQTGLLLRRQSPARVYDSLRGEAGAGNVNAAIQDNLPGGWEIAGPLLLLYLMERIAHYAGCPRGHFLTLTRLSALASLCLEDEALQP